MEATGTAGLEASGSINSSANSGGPEDSGPGAVTTKVAFGDSLSRHLRTGGKYETRTTTSRINRFGRDIGLRLVHCRCRAAGHQIVIKLGLQALEGTIAKSLLPITPFGTWPRETNPG